MGKNTELLCCGVQIIVMLWKMMSSSVVTEKWLYLMLPPLGIYNITRLPTGGQGRSAAAELAVCAVMHLNKYFEIFGGIGLYTLHSFVCNTILISLWKYSY